jgi:hypothetical protein
LGIGQSANESFADYSRWAPSGAGEAQQDGGDGSGAKDDSGQDDNVKEHRRQAALRRLVERDRGRLGGVVSLAERAAAATATSLAISRSIMEKAASKLCTSEAVDFTTYHTT